MGLLGLAASAQEVEKSNNKKAKLEGAHTEVKAKKTSTPKQKVHNVIHPKHKHYSGVKVKAKKENE